MKPTICALSAVLLVACAPVGPDFTSPDLNPPAQFVGGASTALTDAAQQAWWKELNDPALNRLVSIGLTQNLDVQAALERIVEAQANARRFGVAAQQTSGDLSASGSVGETNGVSTDNASVSANAAFVFDLFGGFRRSREQSGALLDAASFDVGTVKLAYLSDVVSAYTLVRFFQSSAQITRETISSRRQTLRVARQRADLQEGTQLDVAQAQALLATAEATLPILEAQAKVNSFVLSTLLNVPTRDVASILATGGGIPAPAIRSSGLPADLLRNRPDIRTAERNLAAATAAIGVSEAQLYPSLNVAGVVSASDPDSWAFGPNISVPILGRGSLAADRDVAQSQAAQSELAYRQTYLQAIEEVQTAIVLTKARRDEIAAFTTAASSSERALNLAVQSYDAGVSIIDTVLDAERARLADRLSLAQAHNDYVQAWVGLQISVGKGWAVLPEDAKVAILK